MVEYFCNNCKNSWSTENKDDNPFCDSCFSNDIRVQSTLSDDEVKESINSFDVNDPWYKIQLKVGIDPKEYKKWSLSGQPLPEKWYKLVDDYITNNPDEVNNIPIPPFFDIVSRFTDPETLHEDVMGESLPLETPPSEPATIADLKIAEANNKIVYDFLVKPILDKADEIIQLLNGLDIPKDKAKIKKNTKTAQRLFNIADDLVAHHYKQPKKEEKIVFTNRANTEYKVVKEDLLNLGYQENYKDVFKKGLDPIVSRDKPVFGLGKVLQPLNKTITAMKKSIDEATSTAQDRYNQHLEAKARAKVEAEAKAKVNDPAQGGNESANN